MRKRFLGEKDSQYSLTEFQNPQTSSAKSRKRRSQSQSSVYVVVSGGVILIITTLHSKPGHEAYGLEIQKIQTALLQFSLTHGRQLRSRCLTGQEAWICKN